MSQNDNEDGLEKALLSWIDCLDGITSTCETIEDLHDGVLLSEIVGQAAPSDMASEEVDEFPTSDEDKEKNVKLVLDGLSSFYTDTFGTEDSFDSIDAHAIATKGPEMHKALHALLKLVIGCVINCADKAVYIESIQQMEPAEQMEIMHIIQDIMEAYSSGTNESFDESFAATSTPNTGRHRSASETPTWTNANHTAEIQTLKDQIQSLEEKLATKSQEALNLSVEVENLQHEMKEAARREKAKDLEKMKNLKAAISQREVEISGGLRDLESQCATLEQRNQMLQRQLKQKDSTWKAKLQAQTDELEILRSTQGRAEQMEPKLRKMAAELQNMNQLREHLREVEEQNLELEDKNGTLAAQNSKIPALNKQLQKYRDRLTVGLFCSAASEGGASLICNFIVFPSFAVGCRNCIGGGEIKSHKFVGGC